MNLVTLITGMVIAMAVLELLLHGMTRLKKSLFRVTILAAFIGFTSKYYYGPDITTYVPLYEGTENIFEFLKGNYIHSYEHGYVCFCAICQTFGMSFWGLTAVISALLFLAIYLMLDKLDDKRVLALAVIMVMLPDLIYAQLRQSLAVTFFVFSVLKAEDWRKSGYTGRTDAVFALLLGLVAMTMHKSAIFIIGLTFIYYFMQPYRMHKSTWEVLLILLLILAIVPTQEMAEGILDKISSDNPAAQSIKIHLAFSKLRQSNIFVYGAALMLLMLYARQRERRGAMVAAAAMGMIMVVAFYQYYYMLNRLKSYFVIIVVYYIFSQMRKAAEERMPYVTIIRQVCEIALLVFVTYKAYSFDQNSSKEGNILQASTIFELSDYTADEIKHRQMLKAEQYWDTQFLKNDSENLKVDKKALKIK